MWGKEKVKIHAYGDWFQGAHFSISSLSCNTLFAINLL